MLGKVLGSCLQGLQGLNAVYLPAGVRISIADDLVIRANEGGDDPYAILVVPAGHRGGMSTNTALKYRQGDRLAVVAGRHPDLGSFTQSFREILGLNYPESATGSLTTAAVARAAVQMLSDRHGVSQTGPWSGEAERILAGCLDCVAGLQKELRQGTESWNVQWFHHVDDGLTRLFDFLTIAKPELSGMAAFFEKYTFAAFGLPRPAVPTGPRFTPKQFAEAFRSHWSDQTTIARSAAHLAHAPDNKTQEPHVISHVDWTQFDREVASTDNLALTFARYFHHDESVTEKLAELTESQFINPTSAVEKGDRLEAFTSDMVSLSVAASNSSHGPFLAVASIDDWAGEVATEEILLRIPILAPVTPDEAATSQLLVRSVFPKSEWTGTLEVGSDGLLYSRGRIVKPLGKGPWKLAPRSHRLVLEMGPEDTLFGRVPAAAACEVSVSIGEQPGLWIAPIRKGGALGRTSYYGPEEMDSLDDGSGTGNYAIDLEPNSATAGIDNCRFIVWSAVGATPTFEGEDFREFDGRRGVYFYDSPPLNFAQIVAETVSFDCRSMASSKAPTSPVVAAISKMLPSRDPLSLETLKSLRGQYETWLTENLSEDGVEISLGHVIMPTDRDSAGFPAETRPESGFAMSTGTASHWESASDLSVPVMLRKSEAFSDFLAAFQGLALRSKLFNSTGGLGGRSAMLPSTMPWKDLWEDRSVLEQYLTAYTGLIREAKRLEDPAGVFWATYPFSISLWSTVGSAKCHAVLLSPLHPIRLAWLAGVEHALWNSRLADRLAGTVEGWNFPMVGPRETEMGRLMAVPMETGEGQVFLGWSMLVQTSAEEFTTPGSPENAGSLNVPGTAVSGLNATAVSAAIRSYRKMNPHVTTLTVDLASSGHSTRLEEVDEAVLTEVAGWSSHNSTPLFGGARIWDSINRGGEPPREKVARLVRAEESVPLVWSRYSPKDVPAMRCNVRILQDGGVTAMLRSAGQEPRLGAIGDVPLRRFEAVNAKPVRNSSSTASPTLRDNQGWSPFTEAVREIEGPTATTEIMTKLFSAQLVSDSADWTVSGESLMSPSAMAKIVQATAQGNQMLWEWRPPFLEATRDIPALERRPFVSVARVPNGFRRQIGRLLSKATGRDVSDQLVNELLERLGTRGVGLSSMLAMGGTHAAGALGFFLVFSLMERLQVEASRLYVLPIDACDTFLRALSADSPELDSKRRADVLIMRLEGRTLTLSPVEIKFYGLDSEFPNSHLPDPRESGALREPLEQVRATGEVLEALRMTWSDIRTSGDPSDQALWTNGLAALVESAARLAPSATTDPVELSKTLSDIASGQIDVRIGRPIVSYFRHEAKTKDGEVYVGAQVENGVLAESFGSYAVLAANSAAAFESLNENDSQILESWRSLVDWSLAAASNGTDAIPTEDEGERVEETLDDERSADLGSGGIETGGMLIPGEEETGNGSGVPPEEVEAEVGAEPPLIPPHILDPKDSVDPQPSLGVRFPVGATLPAEHGQIADFWPSNIDLNQMNVGIVGDLGTGKTQMMKTLIYQLREKSRQEQDRPLSMLIFDYKRDFQASEFLEAVDGRVLRIDNIPLNFFQLREGYTPMAATQRANEFIDVLDKIYSNVGPIQRDRLQVTITDLYRENKFQAPTIGRVLDRYSDGGEKVDAVTSLLRRFVTSEVFTEDPAESQSFDELLDGNVIVVALNDFKTDDDGKNALVVLFLNMYYDYMMNVSKPEIIDVSPELRLRTINSFLLVDEAVNIMKYKFSVLSSLLLQGREFGFGVMLASQYLSHFRQGQEDYAQPLLTWFIHKVPSVTAKDLSMLGLGAKSEHFAQRITSLKLHQSLYKSLGYERGRFIQEIPFYELLKQAQERQE